MAEGGGFEPPIRCCRIHTFQACAFSHSATPPRGPVLPGPGEYTQQDEECKPTNRKKLKIIYPLSVYG